MTQVKAQMTAAMLHNLARLTDVVAFLRAELNKGMPIQHIALLLAVVQQPGISMQALMECLGMPQGSVSRNVKLLSENGRGYGLLRTTQDLVNRKQVVVFPTEKGLGLVGELCRLLDAEAGKSASLFRKERAVRRI